MADDALPPRSWRRSLRAGVSLACLTLGLAYAAFWVRSHYYEHILKVGIGANSRVRIDSLPNGLRLETRTNRERSPLYWHWTNRRRGSDTFGGDTRFPWEHDKLVAGFAYLSWPRGNVRWPRGFGLAAPHWFPVVAFAVAAFALAPPPRWRFSLRRSLAIMTLAAIVLGALAATM
jgi:hypothetical protein